MRALDWLNDKLTRVTSNNRFLPEIDGLRFAAIMSVLVFHLHGLYFSKHQASWAGGGVVGFFNHMVFQGYFGVQLFFVISGFILCLPMAEHNLLRQGQWSLKKYLLRRVTRLEPPFIANLLIMAAIQLLVAPDRWRGIERFLSASTYTHMFFYGHPSEINWASWSLEIEVRFYLTAPLLACVFLLRPRWLRVGLIFGAIVALTLLPYNERTLTSQLRYFLVGFLLVDMYLVDWRGQPAKSRLWDIVGACTWLSLPFCIADAWALTPVWLLVCYVAVFRGQVLSRIFAYRWITAVGGMCYTIYLYHNTMISWLERWGRQFSEAIGTSGLGWLVSPIQMDRLAPMDLLKGVVLLAIVLVVSSLLFVALEKPFMRRDWPQRLWGFAKRLFAPPTAKASVELEEADARK